MDEAGLNLPGEVSVLTEVKLSTIASLLNGNISRLWSASLTALAQGLNRTYGCSLTGENLDNPAVPDIQVNWDDLIARIRPLTISGSIAVLLKELGLTIILVEHRLDLAAKYANSVVVMDKGNVVLTGTPREIFTSEKARLIGVGIPKVTKLYQHLEKNGLKLRNVPVTTLDIVNLLREILKDA